MTIESKWDAVKDRIRVVENEIKEGNLSLRRKAELVIVVGDIAFEGGKLAIEALTR